MPRQINIPDAKATLIEMVQTEHKRRRIEVIDRKLAMVLEESVRTALEAEKLRVQNETFVEFLSLVFREYLLSFEESRIQDETSVEFRQTLKDRVAARLAELAGL